MNVTKYNRQNGRTEKNPNTAFVYLTCVHKVRSKGFFKPRLKHARKRTRSEVVAKGRIVDCTNHCPRAYITNSIIS